MISISGVIITYNEERNIEDCIRSLKGVVDEIVVVDSFSTDHTKDICLGYGIRFIENDFAGHIEQKNFAMNQANNDYILSLDADERLSEALKTKIKDLKTTWKADGYVFNRFNNYCGSWLKHSWYPDRKLRLWDRRKGKWGGTNPHDKVIIDGEVSKVDGVILHYAYDSLEEHYEQVKKFAVIAAHAKYMEGKKVNFFLDVLLNPWFKFFRKYILNLGFLDGKYGFLYCTLAAYLNFMKYARLWELNLKSKRRVEGQ